MNQDKQAELEAALTLMPRIIRDKLDRVGIKLHLKEWQAFSLRERTQLRDAPCESASDLVAYAAMVEALVLRCTGRQPDRLASSQA
ncbi:MAG: hypothetical protein HYR72_07315 [Deltaproteobacteria bacterium]|nr:hypothetical protein [Deltaproteobacteria bacterium]MBI3386650.1 hypothetical protein [Deltaproteobacteria bacterium]